MSQIESLRNNSPGFEAAAQHAARRYGEIIKSAKHDGLEAAGSAHPTDDALDVIYGNRSLESLDTVQLDAACGLEAIILTELRPPYFIKNDVIEIAGAYDHVDLIATNKEQLERLARSVGMVDLLNHPTLPFAGTAWLIESDIAVTNRHVANVFARAGRGGQYAWNLGAHGRALEVRVDYLKQVEEPPLRRRADVTEVLWIAGPRQPDIAFLRVNVEDGLQPLTLGTSRVERGTPLAAVGYPAADPREKDRALMDRLFGGKYDVKRFAPGVATAYTDDGAQLLGDYTSLGGSSGSCVLDLATGKVVGLHFAGLMRETNYAVSADLVASAWARMRTVVQFSGDLPPVETPTSQAAEFPEREGYDPTFLGDDVEPVPLPGLGPWAQDSAPVSDDAEGVIKYRHFSVVQSASRRLPLLSAVNIDGSKSRRLKRKGRWRLDGRVATEHQIGNELYRRNPLDRGHMVRRRDPGWGETNEEAQEAEIDTLPLHECGSSTQGPQSEGLGRTRGLHLACGRDARLQGECLHRASVSER